MTLQQAINSGKLFRRPHHKDWMATWRGIFFWVEKVEGDSGCGIPQPVTFSVQSIFTDDYITKD